jgi:hypothetical protein
MARAITSKKSLALLEELQKSDKLEIVPYQGINIISANCK